MPAVCGASHGLPPGGGVKLWLDSQLSPSLAAWIVERFGVDASTVTALRLEPPTDHAIFEAVRKPESVIVTKDEDFADIVARRGPPPQVLWVRCGNVSNRAMRVLLEQCLPRALDHVRRGDAIVELVGP